MKMIRDCFRYLITGILVLFVLICVYSFVVTEFLHKDYTNIFGYTYFLVASGSMSGTLEVNDIIFVKITDNVSKNDIITYKDDEGELITHRLTKIQGDEYITKGDANQVTDESIEKDQIIGKVKWIIPIKTLLKFVVVCLIVFLFFMIFHLERFFRQLRKKEILGKLPDDLFGSEKKEEAPSGLTVTIALDQMESMNKEYEEKSEEEEVEVLELDENIFDFSSKKKHVSKEKETVDLVLSILKCKITEKNKAKMNKKWLMKYQYVYKLCQLLLIRNTEKLSEEVETPPFSEIYDYDLEKVGLTETIRNRIYELPIYSFLRLLTYCILYNDEEMFDGIYKIMKYKVMVDKNNYFKQLSKLDSTGQKQVKSLIEFMKNISNQFDHKKVFELEKIERLVQIGSYK